MSGRGRRRGRGVLGAVLVAVLCAAFVCGEAAAQKLDLDSADGFKAGTEKSIERQTHELGEAIKEWKDRAAKAEAGGAAALQAQTRVRELVVALLEAGKSLGEAGSVHILTGRRIAAQLKELDDRIGEMCTDGSPEDRRAIEDFVKDCPKDDSLIPRNIDDLDEMLAKMFVGMADWKKTLPVGDVWAIVRVDAKLASADALQQVVDACMKQGTIDLATITAMKSLGAVLTPPERQLVVQASDIASRRPRWLPGKVSLSLGASYGEAVRRLAAPDTRDAAKADLCRLAIFADVLARIDDVRLTPRQVRSMRAIGVAMAEAIGPGDSACDDALGALRRGLMLVEAYDGARWEDNRRIVRELRPLWRATEVYGKRSRDELVEVLAGLKPRMPALSDPAVLGAMSAVRARVDDGRRLCVISEWLSGQAQPGVSGSLVWNSPAAKSPDVKVREPVTQKEDRIRRQAGIKLLNLGQRANAAESHEAAMAAMRELADGLGAWMPIAGEADLRAAASAPDSPAGLRWRELTGGAAADIVKAIETARDGRLSGWAQSKDHPVKGTTSPEPEIDAGRIDLLRQLVELTNAGAGVAAMCDGDGTTGIRAWPGFGLSANSLAVMVPALRADLARASGIVSAGDYAELEKLLAGMKPHMPVLSLLAQLDRSARATGQRRVGIAQQLSTPPAVLPTLGEDLTPVVWMLRERESIAIVCRCLEEYADASNAGDRPRATSMLKIAAAEAERILPSVR